MHVWHIYCIENVVNGKKYVGQTVNSIHHRFKQHISEATRSCSTVLGRAIKKHGSQNFTVKLICEVYSQEEADNKEKQLIEELRTRDRDRGYNVAVGGVSSVMTGLRHTDVTKRRISRAHFGKILSEEHRSNISKMQMGNKKRLGKMHDEETRQKISDALSGRKLTDDQRAQISERMIGRTVSPETRAKIGAANRGKVRTEEMRQRNREAKLGTKQSPEVIEKRIAPLRGRPRSEEVRHKISEGNKGKTGQVGESNGSSKLTEDQVREIKRLLAGGARNIDVMKQFGMSKGAIANIKSERSWSHVILTEEESTVP